MRLCGTGLLHIGYCHSDIGYRGSLRPHCDARPHTSHPRHILIKEVLTTGSKTAMTDEIVQQTAKS